MVPTIALALAGGTTGEWAGALREVFGEYRAPTGVAGAPVARGALADVARRARELPGGPPRLLVAKPGLDGHSNGAEQIAVAARDAGFEVIYQGIRLTSAEIVAAARDEDVDVVGLSVLSGAHLAIVPEIVAGLTDAGVDAAVVVGGIVPPEDATVLARAGGRRGVHAEGLRARRDHVAARGPRRRAASGARDERELGARDLRRDRRQRAGGR